MAGRSVIGRRAISSLTLNIASTGLLALMTLALTQASDPAAFGRYASVTAIVTILTIPVVGGFDRLLIRSIAADLAMQRHELVVGLLRRSRDTALVAAIAAAVLVGAIGVVALPNSDGLVPLLIGLVALPFAALSRVRQAALFGLERVVLGQLPEAVVRPAFVIVVVSGAIYLHSPQFTAVGLVGLHVAATIVAFALGAILFQRAMPRQLRGIHPDFRTRLWLRESISLTAMAGASAAMLHAPIIVLDALSGPEGAATYAVASRLALMVPLPLVAANVVLGPIVARLWALGDQTRLERVLTLGSRLSLVASLPLAITLLILAEEVMGVFGDAYASGAPVLRALVIGQALYVAAGTAGLLLIMTGRTIQAATSQVVVTAMSLPLVAYGTTLAGMEGAAIAATVALIFLNASWLLAAKRLLGFTGTAFGRAR